MNCRTKLLNTLLILILFVSCENNETRVNRKDFVIDSSKNGVIFKLSKNIEQNQLDSIAQLFDKKYNIKLGYDRTKFGEDGCLKLLNIRIKVKRMILTLRASEEDLEKNKYIGFRYCFNNSRLNTIID